MFFILSKILLFLLSPFNWIVMCIVISFIAKRENIIRRWRIIALLLFILFSNYAFYKTCLLAWQCDPDTRTHKKNYSAGILLCGMTMRDQYDSVYFSATADRFLQAARLYHTGAIRKVFISGGTGSLSQETIREADFLRREFMALNVPDSSIIVERYSRNTYESAVAAKRILDSMHLQPPYLLITSAIHMRRSVKTFEKAGISIAAHPANYEVVNGATAWHYYIFPDVDTLGNWETFLKEIIGLMVYQFTGKA